MLCLMVFSVSTPLKAVVEFVCPTWRDGRWNARSCVTLLSRPFEGAEDLVQSRPPLIEPDRMGFFCAA
jgi:hypothetical protein